MKPTLEVLQKALSSAEEATRKQAILAAAQAFEVRLVPLLQRIAQQDPSIELRFLAKKALAFFQLRLRQAQEKKAATGIGEGPQARIRGLLEELRSPDVEVRNNAVQSLGKLGGKDVAHEILLACKRESDPFVRASLAVAVGQAAKEDGLDALRAFLNDEDPRVRANAIEGMSFLPAQQAAQWITPHLKDEDSRVKVNAYTALGKIRKIDLLQALGRMLDSEKVWLRDSAAYALCKLEIPESVPLLERALADPFQGVRLKARNGLVLLAKAEVSQAQKALERVGGERDSPEAYLTTSMVGPRGQIREAAAQVRAPGPQPGGEEARLALIRRIVEADDRGKIAMLVKQLGKEKNPKVLASLISALGQLGDGRLLASLQGFLGSPDRRIRANAVEALGLLGSEATCESLLRFTQDEDNRVRANAVVALASLADRDVSPELEAMVESEDILMRLSAIYAVTTLGSPEYLGFLARLTRDGDPGVSRKALESLQILAGEGEDEAGKILEDLGSGVVNLSF